MALINFAYIYYLQNCYYCIANKLPKTQIMIYIRFLSRNLLKAKGV